MRFPIRPLNSEQRQAIDDFYAYMAEGQIQFESIACPICGSRDHKTLFENDFLGLAQETSLCMSCGLVFEATRPDEESTKHFYQSNLYRRMFGEHRDDRDYTRQYSHNAAVQFDLDRYAQEYLYLFVEQQGLDYQTVCEVGAAGGWNLAPFQDAGKTVMGFEPDHKMIGIGADYGIPLQQGFIDEVTGTYDLVFLRHVLEHLNDPVRHLKALRPAVGKYLLLEVPGFVASIPKIQLPHYFYFSANTLSVMAARAGFELVTSACVRSNDYIFALYRKAETDLPDPDYDKEAEIKNVLRIWRTFATKQKAKMVLQAVGLRRASA